MDSQNWLMTSLELGWNISQGLPREGKLFHWAALSSPRSVTITPHQTRSLGHKYIHDYGKNTNNASNTSWNQYFTKGISLTRHFSQFRKHISTCKNRIILYPIKSSYIYMNTKLNFSSFMSPPNAKIILNRGDIYGLHTLGLPTIYISCSQQFVVIFISFNKTPIINCFITIGWRQFATAALVNFTPCNRVCGSEFINKVLPPGEKLFGNFCWDLSNPGRCLIDPRIVSPR